MKLTVSKEAGYDGWATILGKLDGFTVKVTIDLPEGRGPMEVTGPLRLIGGTYLTIGHLIDNPDYDPDDPQSRGVIGVSAQLRYDEIKEIEYV